ncbi:host-nuclease inhibitor Gam family protein [Azotobacter chroococcum]|uniref:host-nuclease inhibitor Gam family protein n=1 Tax=Azotobacter chroococcum TaxID=353 RepID=UPI001E3B9D74|nr:host-nuclease inhibitor Gam family protein [Azotobacter chroococcum]
MTRATHVKTNAARFPVPQSRDEVNEAIARIGLLQRERERIQADMNDELAKVRLRFEELATPLNEQITGLTQGVHTWCEAHRLELTRSGKTKFYDFAAGEIKWRLRPPRVSLQSAENVLETLKRLGLTRFIRVKEQLNKEAMLAEPEVVSGVAGVKIEQSEDFVIVPFGSNLEEVA